MIDLLPLDGPRREPGLKTSMRFVDPAITTPPSPSVLQRVVVFGRTLLLERRTPDDDGFRESWLKRGCVPNGRELELRPPVVQKPGSPP
jgi:hypothetical protein